MPDARERAPGRTLAWTTGVLVLAAALRVVCGAERSLWLDELHTLHHASAASLGALLEGLRLDNHPPLSFVLVRASRALLGSSELALRAPSIAASLLSVVLVARLARRLPGTWAPAFAPLLAAVSSLQVVVAAEARMYALLGLAVVGLLSALLDVLDGERAGVRLAGWTAFGLHVHYFFLHDLAVLVGATLVLAAARRALRPTLGRLVPGLAAAAALALPWYLWGFREQLTGHELAPGGRLDPWRSLAEALVHLQFHNLSLGGEALRAASLGAAALLGPLVLWAAWRNAGPAAAPTGRSRALLLGAAAFGVPVWAALVATLFPRSGFNWVYLAPSSLTLALVASALPRTRLAGTLLAVVAGVSLLLSGANALSEGTENYRGAVRAVLAAAGPGDAVVAIDPGPAFFPNALGWPYYAPRLASGPLPEEVETVGDYALPPGFDPAHHRRVFVLQRGLHREFPALARLRDHFGEEQLAWYGYGLAVHTFGPREDA